MAQPDIARLRTVPTAAAPAPAGVPRISPRNALVLGTCCLSLFLTGLDNTAVNVGLPMIGLQLHAPVAGLQRVVAAYTVVLASLPCSLARWPTGSGARPCSRPAWPVHARLVAVQPGTGPGVADRLPGAAGRGGVHAEPGGAGHHH